MHLLYKINTSPVRDVKESKDEENIFKHPLKRLETAHKHEWLSNNKFNVSTPVPLSLLSSRINQRPDLTDVVAQLVKVTDTPHVESITLANFDNQDVRGTKSVDQKDKAQELDIPLTNPPSHASATSAGKPIFRTAFRRNLNTTLTPQFETATTPASKEKALRRQNGLKYQSKSTTVNFIHRPRYQPIVDYNYYEDDEDRIIGKPLLNGKLYITEDGLIHCLDQGNFPHPTSCKKFITCARMVANGLIVGSEYTCPERLSFDPVGGICNWSAGFGCKE